MAKGKKSSLSRARISSIKAASNAILTLNGSNITLMDQRFPVKGEMWTWREKKIFWKRSKKSRTVDCGECFPSVSPFKWAGGRLLWIWLVFAIYCTAPYLSFRESREFPWELKAAEVLKYPNKGEKSERRRKNCLGPHQLLPPLGLGINCPPRAGRRGWSAPNTKPRPIKHPLLAQRTSVKLIRVSCFQMWHITRSSKCT